MSSSNTITSRSNAAHSVLLYALVILYKYRFYNLSSSTKELFASGLPLSPRP